MVRAAQVEGQMLPYQSVEGGWTDVYHDAVHLPDLLKSVNWTNEDCLTWPGWDGRTRSGAIRQTFEAMSTHLGRSTSSLNKDLFGKRLESLSELTPFLATLDGRNEGRSTEARDVNNALQAVHEFGDELHRDQSMQRYLQQYKFISDRLYQRALQVQIFGMFAL